MDENKIKIGIIKEILEDYNSYTACKKGGDSYIDGLMNSIQVIVYSDTLDNLNESED